MDNPYNPGTKKWYMFEIKENLTPQVNKRIYEAQEEKTWSSQLTKMVERLQKYGGTNKKYGENYIGLGFKGKSKSMIKRQYQELNRVLDIDVWTPAGIRKAEREEDKAYRSFKNTHKGWKKAKWREFVQIMGNASSEMLREFGYERHGNDKGSKTATVGKYNNSFVEAYELAYKHGKDLFDIMETTYRQVKNKGFTQKGAIDLLFDNIRNEITEEDSEE